MPGDTALFQRAIDCPASTCQEGTYHVKEIKHNLIKALLSWSYRNRFPSQCHYVSIDLTILDLSNPLFLFPPPFFWKRPTGFTRVHQEVTSFGIFFVAPGEIYGNGTVTASTPVNVLAPTLFVTRTPGAKHRPATGRLRSRNFEGWGERRPVLWRHRPPNNEFLYDDGPTVCIPTYLLVRW